MNELQKRIGWQAGDEMYYTRGTQTHVNENEDYIAEKMNAVYDGVFGVHNVLKLKVNNVVSWFLHHGPGSGRGANRGNTMRNYLKNLHFEESNAGREAPDIVYTAHYHNPVFASFEPEYPGTRYKIMHGLVLPSWQGKTLYAWRVASVDKNMIGGVIHEIKADGTITVPKFCVMET
jgi:hypothetical protein